MDAAATQVYTAFTDTQHLAAEPIRNIARTVKIHTGARPESQVLAFDDTVVQPVEFDLRDTVEDVLARLDRAAPSATQPTEPESRPHGPGHPKLGVIVCEVTLLPCHRGRLAAQLGGASITLRKLVEDVCRATEGANRRREAQEAAYHFMSAMVDNAVCFEDATRASFVVDATALESFAQSRSADVHDFACGLAGQAFQPQQEAA